MLSTRRLVFWICALGAFAYVPYGTTRLLDRYAVPTPQTNIELGEVLAGRLAEVASRAAARTTPLVLYLGDSTAMTKPFTRAIPNRLAGVLRDDLGSTPIQVSPLVGPGLWIYDFYFLVDRIIDARPTVVVLTFNAAATSPTWMRFNVHPELAAWIDPTRLAGAAMLPLERGDLNADRLLLYPAIREARALPVWRWVRAQQARIGTAERAWTAWLDPERQRFEQERIAATVARARADEDVAQGRREGQLARYGAAISGLDRAHPTLRMLGATVRALTRAEIPTLVYLFPLNVERFAALDMPLGGGLAQSTAAIQSVVEGAGGEFLDLHALLPQAAFGDAQGHLAIDHGVDGPLLVAEALARRLATFPSLQPSGRVASP